MTQMNRREVLAGAAALSSLSAQTPSGAAKYVRYQSGNRTAYGRLEGDTILEISGPPYLPHKATGKKTPASSATLLAPCVPGKILAVGLNYKSHIGNRTPPSRPELFYKPISCINHPGAAIKIPEGATDVHYEGELVIVIGKQISKASPAEAKDAIFGVTCGNDVSERQWQNGADKDLQWWRAKGADTFGPFGPYIVTGINYGNVLLQTRLNGQVVQKQNTNDLLFDCQAIVVFASRYVTLLPGDIIYTGTPGSTKRMKPGDTVEVEIENIGTLRNTIA